MDRFEIAVHFKNQRKAVKAFRFPPTRYAGKAVKYIEYSIANDGICVADNIPQDALDSAVIHISKIYETPIVIESESEALLFSISHSHKIYSLENLPKSRYVICYNISENSLPYDTQVVGTICGHTGNLKFI